MLQQLTGVAIALRDQEGMPTQIIVFAKVFKNGIWKSSEHRCQPEEIESVIDSALAKATQRGHTGLPLPIDFLAAAHYIFDVARGTQDHPHDGDSCVYAVGIDEIVIGHLAEFRSERLIA